MQMQLAEENLLVGEVDGVENKPSWRMKRSPQQGESRAAAKEAPAAEKKEGGKLESLLAGT